MEHTIFVDRTPPPPARPTLRLSFNTQRSVDVDENAAIGRNPSPVDGRLPVPVLSPERMVSRTHALVDVDDAGRIAVTDHHSGNGIETVRPFHALVGADGAGSSVRMEMAKVAPLGERTEWLDHGYKELEIPPTDDGGFRIDGVTGPDEYTAIVNNNIFTNT